MTTWSTGKFQDYTETLPQNTEKWLEDNLDYIYQDLVSKQTKTKQKKKTA